MPDHFHALLVPRAPYTLSQVMQTIKGYSSRRINQAGGSKGPLWQQSFYDRIMRDEEQLLTAIAYIEGNPVSAAIVQQPQDYVWSSAHAEAITDVQAWLGV